jgi:hypothetical protein
MAYQSSGFEMVPKVFFFIENMRGGGEEKINLLFVI